MSRKITVALMWTPDIDGAVNFKGACEEVQAPSTSEYAWSAESSGTTTWLVTAPSGSLRKTSSPPRFSLKAACRWAGSSPRGVPEQWTGR